jgi:hypothetical protein
VHADQLARHREGALAEEVSGGLSRAAHRAR